MALALLLAVPPAVALGVAAARRPRLAALAVGTAGVIFTIPSLALFALLVAPLGLGTAPAVAALALYSVLPVLRNTVVGLREVDVVDGDVDLDHLEAGHALHGSDHIAPHRSGKVHNGRAVLDDEVEVAGGLGDSIFAGLRADDTTEVLAATAVIAALALTVDGTLALVERGLRRSR